MASPVSTDQIFNNGNSQVVRIHAERGQALLRALQALGEADGQFIMTLEAEQAQSQPMQTHIGANDL